MGDASKLCPSCAGQVTNTAVSCPWCGEGLAGSEATRVATAPPPVAARAPGQGLGDARPLSAEQLPPPPKSLPIVRLNPTQVFLRAVIVIGCLYLLFVVGRSALQASACAIPGSPICH